MSLHRIAIDNLIDSLDYMDATRSHEFAPSLRIRSRQNSRRVLHVLVVTFVGVAALLAWASGP